MRARLQFASLELASRLDAATDYDERETLRRMLDLTRRIEILRPKFLSCSDRALARDAVPSIPEKQPTITTLCHDALSLDNILVDDDGVLNGVIDWQSIPCLPLHETCQFPAFLQQAHDRYREPAGRLYLVDKTGPPHPAYFRDRKRYEITKLRKLYIEEMIRHAPGFVDIWRDKFSANLRDFEAAIQNCDNEFTLRLLEEWVETIEQGQDPARMPKRLHELVAE